MALELAILTPVLLSIVALMFAYGRLAQAQGRVEATARDGARAATQSRSFSEADFKVAAVRDELLGSGPGLCQRKADTQVTPPVFEAGVAVTVVVTCNVKLSDLLVPGAPGSVTIRRTFTSMLDPNRGVAEVGG